MTLACAGCGQRNGPPIAALTTLYPPTPFTCEECGNSAAPLRYCNRCGNESPESELTSYGGRCGWCRTADDIPWEEPAD